MMLKGWDDAVVGWTRIGDRRLVVYDVDRACNLWEDRGLPPEVARHVVLLAVHARRGRQTRAWVFPADAAELREAAETARAERERRKLGGDK